MTLNTETQPILLVEDSDDDFEATIRAFKKSNNLANPVYRCEDGQDALDYLIRKGEYSNAADSPRPSIIMLDLNLPGIDGRKVLAIIKSTPELCTIPVVVLTTSDDSRDIADCYAKGANTYIRKPVGLDNLFEAIRRLEEFWFGLAILPKGQ